LNAIRPLAEHPKRLMHPAEVCRVISPALVSLREIWPVERASATAMSDTLHFMATAATASAVLL
jgi:hypothetical protein